jgi:nucleoside-diphosphate-sugar epimerase
MAQTQILVTGASGFIGSNLVCHLVTQRDMLIYGLSRKHNGQKSSNYKHISIDISAPGWTQSIPSRIDVVVHLAQSYRYRDFPNGAQDMVRINIDATAELLDWARSNGVKRFLFTSTGNVYAASQKAHKETDLCEPQNMYEVTKFCGEKLVIQYTDYFETIVLRLFGVYGAGQTKMIVPMMIEAVRIGKEITLAGGAGLYLSPIYIKDCIKILHQLIVSPDAYKNEIYNIAGKEVVTLSMIVREIEKLLKKEANTCQTSLSPAYLIGSNNKIIHHMKIKSFVPFEKGLKKTVRNAK